MGESSHSQFRRSVNERFTELRTAVDACLQAANGDQNQKKHVATRLVECARSFLAILADADRPAWATRLLAVAENASREHGGNIELVKTLAELYHKIQPVILDELGIESFDACFARLRDSHGIAELFDRMVLQLETIIATNEIDHASVIDAINRLITVLRKNKDGSFASLRGTAWFAVYVKNLLIRLACSVPGIQHAVEAYRDTAAEFQEKVDALDREFTREVLTAVHVNSERIERLTGQTTIELLEVKPCPNPPRITNG